MLRVLSRLRVRSSTASDDDETSERGRSVFVDAVMWAGAVCQISTKAYNRRKSDVVRSER